MGAYKKPDPVFEFRVQNRVFNVSAPLASTGEPILFYYIVNNWESCSIPL